MSNYNGYLLKFGNNIMPNKYITAFSSTPNQRLETSAERDQNGTLQRATLPNYKTKISFSTHILHLDEKIELQRKCRVTYWNDETNSYYTSYFYIPDIEYTVMNAEKNDITYQPITVELIEY